MPVAYVSNKDPRINYTKFQREFDGIGWLSYGNLLDIEQITDILSNSQKSDVLVLTGSVLISSVCLSIWLEMHQEARVYSGVDQLWHPNLISRSSINRMIEKSRDQLNARR